MKYISTPVFDVIADRSAGPIMTASRLVTTTEHDGYMIPTDAVRQWLRDTGFTVRISINEMIRQVRFRFVDEMEAKIFGMAFNLPMAEDLCTVGWEEYNA